MAEGDEGRLVRSKQIAGVAEEFQAALFIYDEGLVGNDMQMANALWRRFFLCMREAEEDVVPLPDPEKLALLVNYVRHVASYLENLDGVEIIVKNQLSWPRL